MSARAFAVARWAGDLYLLSGVVAGSEALEMAEQAHDAYRQVTEVLGAEGLNLTDVVSVAAFLRHAEDFAAYDAVWREVFPDDPPARTTIAAQLLVPGALVELTVTAYAPSRGR